MHVYHTSISEEQQCSYLVHARVLFYRWIMMNIMCTVRGCYYNVGLVAEVQVLSRDNVMVCDERNVLFGDAGVQYLQLRGRQRSLQMITPSNKRENTLAESDYGPESSDFGAFEAEDTHRWH
jgi:hypothetical protein